MGIVLAPAKSVLSHPTEEILEEYIFHRLPETLATQVEEHLLGCDGCQDAITETDRFVSALKIVVRHPDLAGDAAPGAGRLRSFWRLATRPTSLAPVLILALLAVLVVRKNGQEPLTPVAVRLSSMRGPANQSPAPAGRTLQLHIDAPGLVHGREYWVEVVDAEGRQVWKGAVTETGGELAATMSKRLGAGVYWVRLYGADSELLREFGMSAE